MKTLSIAHLILSCNLFGYVLLQGKPLRGSINHRFMLNTNVPVLPDFK
uniref:Uncharacterized protein n=1 Tax=Anguilla anguilla TaxID=7936 RepID=A0A0E9SW32_ANGAN